VIKRYGLLNTTIDPTTRAYGVPHPGTFILDPGGIVVARFFEAAYQERNTVASVATKIGRPLGRVAAVRHETDHLTVVTYASDEIVAPGNRFSLVLEVTPKPGMHVYAPGQHPYRVIALRLDPALPLTIHPLAYPPSQIYHFKPLDERVAVYQQPFTLVQDVTLLVTAATRERARASGAKLELTGTLEYQACDDRICYPPVDLPVTWSVALRPLQ
jgi:DsbC/DsbD-like thiol-disulfide interchange protein